MRKGRKPFYKTLLFWELLIGGLVIAGIVIFVLIELGKPVPDVSKPDDDIYEVVEDQKQEQQQEEEPILEANPIGLSDFRMQGDYLSCTTAPSVLGIDISTWQTYVDWEQVKDAGVEFAIIRAGYRGSESGEVYDAVCTDAEGNEYDGEDQPYIFDEDVGVLTTYGAFKGNGYIRISLVVKDNVAITSADVADLSITLK